MEDFLCQLSVCIEHGKINAQSPHPPDMKGLDGAIELTQSCLNNNIKPKDILEKGLLTGMQNVGEKFRDRKIFIPEVLIAAKAMNVSMELLKPYFTSGEIKHKGKIVLGTVAGDLHDIGKNIVKMIVEGGGWQVIDLGVNVSAEQFIESIKENNSKLVGLSALLTTTMLNMESIVRKVKEQLDDVSVIIGGAPVTEDFARQINADAYFADPQKMLDYINDKHYTN
ncbi:MAG: corrinoid protein [Ignavibacteriaceae bacterium]